jgi:hypothetical protein
MESRRSVRTPVDQRFIPISRWHPEGVLHWLTRPHQAQFVLGRGPVAVRCAADGSPPAELATVTTWSFDRSAAGDVVRIEFASPADMKRFAMRWRILADAIHRIGRDDPAFAFHGVRIALGDGARAGAPPDVLAFARLPGAAVRLIPNPYLLRRRGRLPAARSWERKTDTLYFRGSSTGVADYHANTRVALCRAASRIPRSDCRVSRLKQVEPAFAARLRSDGLIGGRHPPTALNRHRFLVEADGNCSSWDRYLLIGSFGGVPIRFETAWEECWHDLLVDGRNCLVADRHTLSAAIERLRADDRLARRIAARASDLVAEHLSPRALDRRLAGSLAGR